MKKDRINLYIIIDFLYLITIFFFLKYHISDNLHSFKSCLLISLIFVGIYVIRYFFRPSYEDVVKIRNKGWKITGYYSKKALSNKNIYLDSYSFWVKINLIMLLLYCLIFIAINYQNTNFTVQLMIIHIFILCILQVFAWLGTNVREKQKWR